MWAYVVNLAVLISINAILAVTLNFILGYAGIFSIAHALFFGVGAYTATFVAMKFGAGFLSATAAGMALAALISLALALPALRVRGEYFVAASLGLQMLAITVFTEWKSVTGGIGGLTNIPPARIFGFEFTQPEHFLVLSLSASRSIILDHPRPGALELRPQPEGHPRRRDGRMGLRQERRRHQDARRSCCPRRWRRSRARSTPSTLSFINVESFVLDTSIQLMAMVIIGGTARCSAR